MLKACWRISTKSGFRDLGWWHRYKWWALPTPPPPPNQEVPYQSFEFLSIHKSWKLQSVFFSLSVHIHKLVLLPGAEGLQPFSIWWLTPFQTFLSPGRQLATLSTWVWCLLGLNLSGSQLSSKCVAQNRLQPQGIYELFPPPAIFP